MVLLRNPISINMLVTLLVLLLKFNDGVGSDVKDECKRCGIENESSLICKGLSIRDGDGFNFQCLPANLRKKITAIYIENSTISAFDFDFVETESFPKLTSLNITSSNVTTVIGTIPCRLSTLSLQNNTIQNFTAILGQPKLDGVGTTTSSSSNEGQEESTVTEDCGSKSFSLDLRNNSVKELPVEFVSSPRLKSLYLSGNLLKCEFIWENVWEHLQCQNRSSECKSLFADRNSTTCQFYLQPSVQIFQYNLAQIFDSKITLENECSEMNKTCDCHPFNLLREEGGKPTVYLAVNCFGKNFTELPTISEYTWELNVSHNHIQNLEKLNSSMYKNLRRLDLSYNFVNNLNDITTTAFVDRFDLLYINSNKFQQIPNSFFDSIKGSDGEAKVKIGIGLECDCKSATETKGRMIEVKDKIKDLNDVVCWNLIRRDDPDEDVNYTSGFMRLSDLKIQDVCPMSYSEVAAFNWMVLIIVLEVLCITGVLLKVFYDWREYQRTGILPWMAEKLPRLPCDGILE